MLTDIIDALDRRYRLAEISCADGPSEQPLVEAHRFLGFLESEPRLAAAYDDLCRDGMRQIERFRAIDEEIVQSLIGLRRALAEQCPQVDDSSKSAPGDNDYDPSYQFSLAAFNEIVAHRAGKGARLSLYPDDTADDSTAARLLGILQGKYQAAVRDDTAGDEPSEALVRDLWNADQRVTRMHREWMLFSRTSLEAAAVRLVLLRRYLLPDPQLREEGDHFIDIANKLLADGFHPLHDMRARLFGEKEEVADTPGDARAAAIIRSVMRLVHGRSDCDRLTTHWSAGISSVGTRTWMVRALPGCRWMRPRFSSSTTMR